MRQPKHQRLPDVLPRNKHLEVKYQGSSWLLRREDAILFGLKLLQECKAGYEDLEKAGIDYAQAAQQAPTT